jgi:hypothetical protein
MLVTLEGETHLNRNLLGRSFWSKLKRRFRKAVSTVTSAVTDPAGTISSIAKMAINPLENPLINPMKNPLLGPILSKTPIGPVMDKATVMASQVTGQVMKMAGPMLPMAGMALGIPPNITAAALPLIDSALKGKLSFSDAMKAAEAAGLPIPDFNVATNMIAAGTAEAREAISAQLKTAYPDMAAKIDSVKQAFDVKEVEVAKKALAKAVAIKAKKARDIIAPAPNLYRRGMIR